MAWNAGPHKRKFIRSRGRYVGEFGVATEADLVFWGEWEGASRVTRKWRPQGCCRDSYTNPFERNLRLGFVKTPTRGSSESGSSTAIADSLRRAETRRPFNRWRAGR